MFDALRTRLLGCLRVPPEPQAPFGDPASVKVFRAGQNFYRLRLLGWLGGQVAAVAGLVFWLGVLIGARAEVQRAVGDWAMLLWVVKGASVAVFLVQLPVTYAMVRLDYEMRWYIVTDRSLRIRTGVWKVQEMTMSFANIQHVAVSQGPLQRLLGLADVQVRSAGGGGDQQAHPGQDQSMHRGHFHCVDNAETVRDLILERLKRFREAGLGDPEDLTSPTEPSMEIAPSLSDSGLRDAIGELRSEAARLGETLRGFGSH
jgi:membrane protein YdbS with pleckstrin-like domain